MDREGRVRIPLPVARIADLLARVEERTRRVILGEETEALTLGKERWKEGHQCAPFGARCPTTVGASNAFPCPCPFACGLAAGSTDFTSAAATTGRNRTNRQNMVKKSPKLPISSMTSHIVG